MAGGDWLRDRAHKAATVGGRAACHAMSQEARDDIRRELGKRSHAWSTKTPAPAGGPPARISGRLQATVLASLPRQQSAGVWVSDAGSFGSVYAHVQERGMTIHATRAPYLVFFWIGRWHYRKSVTIPARPFVKPTVEALRSSGRLHTVSARAFFEALHG